jgi:hypothetical protein
VILEVLVLVSLLVEEILRGVPELLLREATLQMTIAAAESIQHRDGKLRIGAWPLQTRLRHQVVDRAENLAAARGEPHSAQCSVDYRGKKTRHDRLKIGIFRGDARRDAADATDQKKERGDWAKHL